MVVGKCVVDDEFLSGVAIESLDYKAIENYAPVGAGTRRSAHMLLLPSTLKRVVLVCDQLTCLCF
jgi:hypothetical protein